MPLVCKELSTPEDCCEEFLKDYEESLFIWIIGKRHYLTKGSK